jgi:hypothetical protein
MPKLPDYQRCQAGKRKAQTQQRESRERESAFSLYRKDSRHLIYLSFSGGVYGPKAFYVYAFSFFFFFF